MTPNMIKSNSGKYTWSHSKNYKNTKMSLPALPADISKPSQIEFREENYDGLYDESHNWINVNEQCLA